MGCGGGFRGFFDAYDSCERPIRRGYGSGYDSCGSDSYYNNNMPYNGYRQNDIEEKMIVLKKMYAEDIIGDAEYQKYKQLIYENNIGFEDLMDVRINKSNNSKSKTERSENINVSHPENEYEEKLKKLDQTKQKIIQMQEKLSAEIQGLHQEKEKMEALAETMLKASEEKAETFIRKKLDIEENIQNLEKSNYELQKQIEDIDIMIKTVQTKKLELEALKLKEEISNMKLDL
jgi:hypothetical protein